MNVADFKKRIEADPDLKPGDLPWQMSQEEWECFKENPDSFRKKMHVQDQDLPRDDSWSN